MSDFISPQGNVAFSLCWKKNPYILNVYFPYIRCRHPCLYYLHSVDYDLPHSFTHQTFSSLKIWFRKWDVKWFQNILNAPCDRCSMKHKAHPLHVVWLNMGQTPKIHSAQKFFIYFKDGFCHYRISYGVTHRWK